MDDPEAISKYLAAIGSKGGKIGGKAKVAKGFATMSPAKKKAAQEKSAATRRAKQK